MTMTTSTDRNYDDPPVFHAGLQDNHIHHRTVEESNLLVHHVGNCCVSIITTKTILTTTRTVMENIWMTMNRMVDDLHFQRSGLVSCLPTFSHDVILTSGQKHSNRISSSSSMAWSSWFRFSLLGLFFCYMISPIQSTTTTTTTTCPKQSIALDEQSVVLITGAAGFVGSTLAMALHRVYHVRHVILIDSMDDITSYGSKLISALSQHPANTTLARLPRLGKTHQELALREFKRQRIFHVLQTLGSAATLYRADLRPTLPEYFDIGEIPTLDYIMSGSSSNGMPITHVVHLADAYHGGHNMENEDGMFTMEATNPQATQAVPRTKEHPKAGMMETMLEQLYKIQSTNTTSACPALVPHFVYASSYEVYNHLPHRKSNVKNPPPFDEAKPITTPSSLRGASKLMEELLVRAYHTNYGINAVGLRFFCIYGPWGVPGSPLYELAQRAVIRASTSTMRTTTTATTSVEEEQPLLPDDDAARRHVRDYVYIDDAVDAIMSAMQFQSTVPVVINVGTGVGSTLGDVVDIMNNYLPHPRNVKSPQARKKAKKESSVVPSTISIASTERAKELLGFEAQVSLHEGIGKLLAWHYDRAHPTGNQEEEAKVSVGQNQTFALLGIAACAPMDDECFNGAPVFPCASECSHAQQCQPSYWDSVAKWTRSLTATCETVLYTVDLSEELQEIASAHRSSAVPGSNCNLAFVSETSVLVRQFKETNRMLRMSWWSSISRTLWNPIGPQNDDSSLLRHGIWTFVPVLPDSNHTELAWLPKLSPGFLFGAGTRRAIYCDPNVVFRSVTKLLEEAAKQPLSPVAQGATAMLIGKRLPHQRQHQRRRVETMITGSRIKEALQQAAYRMAHIAVHDEMPQEAPLLDSSFVVHTLQQEDSRQFRCDVYGEMVQWGATSDDRPALQLMMSLHDMWSRVLVQNSGITPWWVGDSVKVVPEESAAIHDWSTSRHRRRLQNLALHHEDVSDRGTLFDAETTVNDKRIVDRVTQSVDETRTTNELNVQPGTTRRLDNVEDALESGWSENKADGKESIKVKDGFGAAVFDVADESTVKLIEAQAVKDENDGSKDEDDDERKEKTNGAGVADTQPMVDHLDKGKAINNEGLESRASTAQDASSRDTWMGVLSSTQVHYFVRIIPASMVDEVST